MSYSFSDHIHPSSWSFLPHASDCRDRHKSKNIPIKKHSLPLTYSSYHLPFSRIALTLIFLIVSSKAALGQDNQLSSTSNDVILTNNANLYFDSSSISLPNHTFGFGGDHETIFNYGESPPPWVSLERFTWPAPVGGVFAGLAVLIAYFHLRQHFKYNNDSQLRRHVLRILWMVPVYAIEAWLGLFMKKFTLYWDVLRDVYESVVIYSFFQFLLVYLGGTAKLDATLCTRPQQPHIYPFNHCLKPWSMQSQFLFYTRLGVTQYVMIKSTMAILTFSLAAADLYEDGVIQPNSAYFYIALTNNFSQGVALYCLVLFYMVTKDDLSAIRPMAKFLCIKAVVFFTFWQSVAITILVAASGYNRALYPTESASAGLQDFLVCIEMFIASIGHIYAFPSMEFHNSDGGDEESKLGVVRKLFNVITPTDLIGDMRELTRMNKKYQHVLTTDTPTAEKGNKTKKITRNNKNYSKINGESGSVQGDIKEEEEEETEEEYESENEKLEEGEEMEEESVNGDDINIQNVDANSHDTSNNTSLNSSTGNTPLSSTPLYTLNEVEAKVRKVKARMKRKAKVKLYQDNNHNHNPLNRNTQKYSNEEEEKKENINNNIEENKESVLLSSPSLTTSSLTFDRLTTGNLNSATASSFSSSSHVIDNMDSQEEESKNDLIPNHIREYRSDYHLEQEEEIRMKEEDDEDDSKDIYHDKFGRRILGGDEEAL